MSMQAAILDVLPHAGAYPTAADVADALGLDRGSASARLSMLRSRGRAWNPCAEVRTVTGRDGRTIERPVLLWARRG